MGTKYRGTEEEIRALNAYIKLVRAAESVTARLKPSVSSAGLTLSQFGVLEALFHLGPLSQKTLGEKILKTSGNITVVVDNLEKRGLVKREQDPSDRRCTIVSLTEKGQELIREIFPRHVSAIVEEMKVLTPSEQEELGRLCRKLGLKIKDGR